MPKFGGWVAKHDRQFLDDTNGSNHELALPAWCMQAFNRQTAWHQLSG